MPRLHLLLACFFFAPGVRADCGYVTVGKLSVYYCEQGKGSPVVLVHAGFLDRHEWDKQVAALAAGHRVITIDLPGHGRSFGVDTTINIGEVLRRTMRKLNVAAASFVGISLGASCLIDFALAHPEMVSRLVLCSPGVTGWQGVIRLDTLSRRLLLRTDMYADTHDAGLITENFLHVWLDGPFRSIAPVDSSVRNYVSRAVYDRVSTKKGSGPVFGKRTAAKRLKQIRKPTLILYGTLDIPFVTETSKYIHAAIRGSQLRSLNAAHLVNLESPELVTRYIADWVR